MIYLRRFLTLLTPSPVAGCVAILAALAVGYLLWTELEPAPRHVTTVAKPLWKDGCSHKVTFAPDGSALVIHFTFTAWGEERAFLPDRAAVHLFDFATNNQVIISEEIAPPITFAPGGKQIAGFAKDTVIVWDRGTGKELKRYHINPGLRQQNFEPMLAFISNDWILWNDWSLDENEKVQRHMIALSTQKPRNGDENIFDRLHTVQKSQPLRSVVSSDGKFTLSQGMGGFDLSDANGKVIQSLANSGRFEITHQAGISPDAKILIANGKIWRPLQAAYDSVRWAYSDLAEEPSAVDGALLVDFESGMEIAFLQSQRSHFHEFGVTPDSKSFVMIELPPHSNSAVTLKIYDWPLARPWWRICGGVLLAFFAIVLIGKTWRWFRGTRTLDDDDETPLTKPPWETNAEASEDGDEQR
jgi:hypothetical protein